MAADAETEEDLLTADPDPAPDRHTDAPPPTGKDRLGQLEI